MIDERLEFSPATENTESTLVWEHYKFETRNPKQIQIEQKPKFPNSLVSASLTISLGLFGIVFGFFLERNPRKLG